jgi:putative transposase
MEERGVNVDHATLNRWVIRYAPAIAAKAHSQKRNTNRSWRMDETYIKVKGKWVYLYRAVDSHGDTLDPQLAYACDRTVNNGYSHIIVKEELTPVSKLFIRC